MNNDLTTQEHGDILVITINRPEARNAMTLSVATAIAAALDELDQRTDLNIGILTGAEGTFCAGMDLKGFLRGEIPRIPGRGFAGLTRQPPVKPLIAAVEGYALAGGFEMVLACDLVIAGEGSQFGIPEVKRGLAATGGGLLRLPRQLPHRIAMELALTGDMLSAERALALGLINQLVPKGQALEMSIQMARRITANGPLAVAASKQVIKQSRLWEDTSMWERQEDLTQAVLASNDAKEGATAFAEKRAPRWTRT